MYLLLLYQMHDIISIREVLFPKIRTTHFHAQLGVPDKGCTIKVLVVCNVWYLEPLGLLNGLALGCYQPSSEV